MKLSIYIYLASFFFAILFQQSLSAELKLIFDASELIPGTEQLQLECVGGTAQGSEFEPGFVECTQRNTNTGSKEWECEAQLGPFVTFDSLEVFCMQGDSIDNLKHGANHKCGLKYHLDYTDETTITGSFVTVVFVLIIMIFIARQRRPPNPQFPNAGGPGGVGAMGGGAGGAMGGAGGGGGNGAGVIGGGLGGLGSSTPVDPRVLRTMAYGIFGVVAFATVVFSAIIFYLCTSVTTLIT